MQNSFEVGQIVYILSEQAQTVIPGIVVEERVVKTINGNTTSWKIKAGAPNKCKVFDSLDIKGQIYTSMEEVHTVVVERLTKFVDNLFDQTKKRVEDWYGKDIANMQNVPQTTFNSSKKISTKTLTEPDDILSSIVGAEEVTTNTFTNAVMPIKTIKEKLRERVLVDDNEEDDDLSSSNETLSEIPQQGTIIDNNGQRIKFNIKTPEIL